MIDIQANSNIWEGQFIEIEHENVGNKKITLGNVYRPPHDINDNYNQFINEFVPILSEFGKSKCDVVIAGDYNIDLLKVLEKTVFSEYFDAVTALNFFTKITLPTTSTRFSKRSCTLIDNFLCKYSHRLSESIAGILLNKISDHLPYFISMNNVNIKQNKTKRIIKIKQQNESNVAKFKAEMSHANLDSKLDLCIDADPNINYDILELTITDAANKHLPTKAIKVNKHKHKKSNWITYGIIKSIKFRDRLYMKLKKTATNTVSHDTISTNLKTYNKILKTSIRAAKGNFYHARFELCKYDIKKTWAIIKRDNKEEISE